MANGLFSGHLIKMLTVLDSSIAFLATIQTFRGGKCTSKKWKKDEFKITWFNTFSDNALNHFENYKNKEV